MQAFGEEPLTYQWEKDGVPVQVGSASDLVFNNVTFGDAGRYRAVVSNAFGSATSNEAVLDVFSSDPIGDALDFPGQTWTNVGSADWFAQTIVNHDGVDAMQSGNIADNQTSIFTLSISGPLDLSFWWKASTEDFFDPLQLLFDGVEQARLSGERDWHRQLLRVPQGQHTVSWGYIKDESVSDGADTVWVDELEIFDIDGYLNEAVESDSLIWEGEGASWFAQSAVASIDGDALQSGPIPDLGESVLRTSIEGPGELSFLWKVSSQSFSDILSFVLDGAEQASISGEVDWQGQLFTVGNGNHTVEWIYRKNSSNESGADAGWLDGVSFDQNYPPVLSDFTVSGNEDTDFQFSLSQFENAFADQDAGDTLSSIRITSLPQNGELKLNDVPVLLNQQIFDFEIAGLEYTPEENWNGQDAFDWNADDGLIFAEQPATVTLDVGMVNDPPGVTVPGTVAAVTGIDQAIAGIAVTDVDAGVGFLTVTFTVASGVITLSETVPGGLIGANIGGNGSNSVTVTSALGALNATLSESSGLSYLSDPGFTDQDTLDVAVNDNGNVGSGGQLQAAASLAIDVLDGSIEDWLGLHFDPDDLEDPNLETTLWGDSANPDGDRIPNLIEYFMALNPNDKDDDESFEFEVDTNDLVFVYRKSKSALGVTGIVEWSNDLQASYSSGINESVVRDEPDATVIEARLPIDTDAKFIRLRVVSE